MAMQLGAEPRKVAILVGLLVVAAGAYYWASRPEEGPAGSAAPAARPATPQQIRTAPRAAQVPRRPGSGGRNLGEFKPTLKVPEGTDLTQVDPTLRLDRFAQVRNAPAEASERSLFDFGAAAPPLESRIAALPKVAPVKPAFRDYGPPKPEPPAPKAAPPAPQAPPVPLKYYGFQTVRRGARRAFFLENEDIFVAAEGELIKNRYKVVRIGVNSVVVEDTQFPSAANAQQTLRLEQETSG